jgi:uncharacterized protein YdeI (YjbR/CyaY-like superfamily)
MGTRDKRIDAYIAKSAPFARPILERIRADVHAASPEIVEDIKWGAPHFMYKGILCGMSAFKEHCAFGFWNGALVVDKRKPDAMGQFGRITDVAELPSARVLAGYVKAAIRLKDEGVKRSVPRPAKPRKPLPVPAYFTAALRKKKALANFEDFTPSKQREYVEWLTEAKTEATRERRLGKAIEQILEGKGLNWKYQGRG